MGTPNDPLSPPCSMALRHQCGSSKVVHYGEPDGTGFELLLIPPCGNRVDRASEADHYRYHALLL